MELTNEFTVNVPVDEAWLVLTDMTKIAPAMPGAKLETVEGDQYRGSVKVKVGPVTAEYKGAATFLERDDAAHRAVVRAEGRETRGQGNATATITATLVPAGEGTRVSVVTDLSITGRVAQFGRGVLADVSNKLLGQFVASLETTVLGAPANGAGVAGDGVGAAGHDGPGAAPGTGAAGVSGRDRTDPAPVVGVTEVGTAVKPGETGQVGVAPGVPGEDREVVPVDLGRVVGPVIAKRLAAPLLGLVVFLFLWRRHRRRAG
jgi:carbon monoxide dehydrogenase subunit G